MNHLSKVWGFSTCFQTPHWHIFSILHSDDLVVWNSSHSRFLTLHFASKNFEFLQKLSSKNLIIEVSNLKFQTTVPVSLQLNVGWIFKLVVQSLCSLSAHLRATCNFQLWARLQLKWLEVWSSELNKKKPNNDIDTNVLASLSWLY